ncbi:MAG: RidA family protein [Rhodospirillaceae bacterium]|nr:RidA family protein [Rhodospirillaceae bacterium]
MLRFIDPDTIARPFSTYSHLVEAPEGCRWLYISGQVGATPDGTILEGFEAQAQQTWSNLLAALRAGGMDVRDIVKINTFLTRRDDITASRLIREVALRGHKPASTLLVVSALAHPSLLIEIEAVAAQPMAAAAPVAARRAARAKPAPKKRAAAQKAGAAKARAGTGRKTSRAAKRKSRGG